MIRLELAPEPEEFEEKVRQKGRAALLELVGDPNAPPRRGRPRKILASCIEEIPPEKLPTYWRKALPDLRNAYNHTCAYLGMRIHTSTGAATVDHFRPKSQHKDLAYEWSNFRLASHQMNTNKGDHEDVLDPFEIQPDWFELDIGTFKVVPGSKLDAHTRAKVVATIKRLKLNEPTYRAARTEYHDRYHGLASWDEEVPQAALPLSWLSRECVFVALELRRQGRLREADIVGTSQERV